MLCHGVDLLDCDFSQLQTFALHSIHEQDVHSLVLTLPMLAQLGYRLSGLFGDKHFVENLLLNDDGQNSGYEWAHVLESRLKQFLRQEKSVLGVGTPQIIDL